MVEKVIRARVHAVLGRQGFLRLNKENDCLYATDFPLRHPAAAQAARAQLEQEGFTVVPKGRDGRLWGVDMTGEKWLHFLSLAAQTEPVPPTDDTLPLWSLAHLFEQNTEEDIACARLLMKASAQKTDRSLLCRRLGALYALCLREKRPRPGKGCAGLIREVLKGSPL